MNRSQSNVRTRKVKRFLQKEVRPAPIGSGLVLVCGPAASQQLHSMQYVACDINEVSLQQDLNAT